MSSPSILATKILVISSGVILIAMTMKMTIIPWLINFTESELPIIWSFSVSLCKPPYLYVVINGIIITIAASSRFARTETETEWSSSGHDHSLISAKPPPTMEIQHDMFVCAPHAVEEVVMVHDNNVLNKNPVMEKVEEQVVEPKDAETVKERVETDQHQQLELVLPVRGKLRALSRFSPPKPSKLAPQGKRAVIIEESSRKSEEVTLESMWKTIMEGREEPLEQSIKKSDVIREYTQKVEDESKWRATSFKGGASYLSEAPIKSWILKKEPTLGQDELNRRADEFIHKFNEEMRMQRQQSLNQNINTIARGAY